MVSKVVVMEVSKVVVVVVSKVVVVVVVVSKVVVVVVSKVVVVVVSEVVVVDSALVPRLGITPSPYSITGQSIRNIQHKYFWHLRGISNNVGPWLKIGQDFEGLDSLMFI